MADFVAAPLPASEAVRIEGFAEGMFAPLEDVFARAVVEQGGGGAALSIRYRGRHVVDLVGGDYAPDALQLLFSVTKSVAAIAAAHAHEAGEIDLDAPLASYWPEFARSATRTISLRDVLSHRSGLAAFDEVLTFDQLLAGEDDVVIGRQEPYWKPGTRHGYHAFTYGTLLTGAFRRVLGRTVGDYVDQNLTSPLGLDLWLRTPQPEMCRIHPISYSRPRITPLRANHLAATHLPPSAAGRLMTQFDLFNDPRLYSADWPSSSGVADARSLSALFAATLDGTLLSTDARDRMIRTRARGRDEVLGIHMHYGSGMQLPFPQLPFLGPGSYGHEAAGGTVAFADRDHDVAVAWTSSVYPPMMGASPGFLTLLGALRHCLIADPEELP